MNEDKYEEINELIVDQGLTLIDYFKYLANKNSKLLEMPKSTYDNFCELLNSLDDRNLSTSEKGKTLEKLVFFMFPHDIFEVIRNARTSTNEIDLLVRCSEKARSIGLNNTFDFMQKQFIGECKNYGDKISVTYVGKFYSLLKTSNTQFGIMFSLHGLTGTGKWQNSKGLVRKIALKDNLYIIDFNKSDFIKIKNKQKNFFQIIDDKYFELQNDIDFSKYVFEHEKQDYFK